MLAWGLSPHGPALLVAWRFWSLNAWLCAVIAHNTVHTPVFTKRWLNQAFQVWVSLSYGFPISEYTPGHNLSHHRFTQMEDRMRTTRALGFKRESPQSALLLSGRRAGDSANQW